MRGRKLALPLFEQIFSLGRFGPNPTMAAVTNSDSRNQLGSLYGIKFHKFHQIFPIYRGSKFLPQNLPIHFSQNKIRQLCCGYGKINRFVMLCKRGSRHPRNEQCNNLQITTQVVFLKQEN